MTDDLERYRRAEARAFVAHNPGFRAETVDGITLVSIGAEAPPEMIAAAAREMDARSRAGDTAERDALAAA